MAKQEIGTDVKSVLFETVALEWLEKKREKVAITSYAQYEKSLKKLLEKIRNVNMNDLCKKEMLKKLEADFLAEDYAPTTVRYFIGLIINIINYYQGELKNYSFCKDDFVKDVISKDDLEKIMILAKDDKFHENYKKLGVLIILYTGITISELTALKWKDVDMANNFLVVSNAFARVPNFENGKTELQLYELPKQRKIPMHPNLRETFNLYMSEYIIVQNFILSNSNKPFEARNYNSFLRTFSIDFEYTITPSALRETFIITGLKNGISPIVLAEVLGMTLGNLIRKYHSLINVSEAQIIEQLKLFNY